MRFLGWDRLLLLGAPSMVGHIPDYGLDFWDIFIIGSRVTSEGPPSSKISTGSWSGCRRSAAGPEQQRPRWWSK